MLTDVAYRLERATFHNKPLFQKVLTAIDTSEIIVNGAVKYDSAFVVPVSHVAEAADDSTLVHSQQININFGVVLSVRSANDRFGSAINDRLVSIIDETRKTLLGWSPDPDYNEITLLRGDVLAFMANGVLWQEEYKTDYLFRGAK